MDGRALEKIVDFAYTGEIELAGSTVVSIIRAANLLQVRCFLPDQRDGLWVVLARPKRCA